MYCFLILSSDLNFTLKVGTVHKSDFEEWFKFLENPNRGYKVRKEKKKKGMIIILLVLLLL